MGFLKSLFTSTAEDPQAKQQKEIHKKFELLKYDGMRAHRMEQIDIAVQCFEKALLLEDDFETRGYLARLYIRTHRMGEAHSLLYPMFQEEPTHLPTLMALGYTYYLLNMYDRAAELAQTVLSIEENNAEAHTLLGAAIIRQINKDNNPDADILLVAGVAQLTIALMLDETLRNARLLRAQTCLLMYRYDDARADAEYLL
ncbi:MAG: hypothetical protein LBM62_07165, partial [Mediterranea sp.]|nr:hypothetical protein [Mediterranea sp.]